MTKELITRKLDFKGCTDLQDFYERVMESLDLEVGVCGLSREAIYDSVREESIVEKVRVKNTLLLTDELKAELPLFYETFEKIKSYHESRGETFVYEVLEGEAAMYDEPYIRTLDFKGCSSVFSVAKLAVFAVFQAFTWFKICYHSLLI